MVMAVTKVSCDQRSHVPAIAGDIPIRASALAYNSSRDGIQRGNKVNFPKYDEILKITIATLKGEIDHWVYKHRERLIADEYYINYKDTEEYRFSRIGNNDTL